MNAASPPLETTDPDPEGVPDPAPGILRRLGAALLVALMGAVGVFMAFSPTLKSRFAMMQSDPGDTLFLNYILEHYLRLATRPNYVGSLWSPPFFFPVKNVLAYSENIFGAFPVYAALRLGLPPLTAFQVWTILMIVFTYAAFVFLMRRLGARTPLAALSGFVFAFGMPRVCQIGHEQLLSQFWSPLALLGIVLFLRSPSRGLFAQILSLLYLQMLCGIYLGWFLILGSAIFICVSLALDAEVRRRCVDFARRHLAFCAAAIACWIGGMYLTFSPYLSSWKDLGPRPWSQVVLFLPRLRSWISAPFESLPASIYTPFAPAEALVWEHHLFAGVIPLVLAAGALVFVIRDRGKVSRDDRNLILGCWALFAICFIGSLRLPALFGHDGLSLWWFVYRWVPGAKAIRAVGRIWTVAYLFLFIAAFLGTELWLRRRAWRRPARTIALGVLLCAGVGEQWLKSLPAFEKGPFWQEVQSVQAEIRPDCRSIYVPVRSDRPFYVSHLVAMWAGLNANVPVMNGYSGNSPPGYPDLTRSMTRAELATWSSGFPAGSLPCALSTGSDRDPSPRPTLTPGESSPPIGFLDVPASGQTVRGDILFQGWALSESGVARVEIVIDGRVVKMARLGQSRPDVARVYPDQPDAASSGWDALIPTASLSTGAHLIVIRAHTSDDHVQDVATVPIVVSR